MTTITYRFRDYPVLETVTSASGARFAKIDTSTRPDCKMVVYVPIPAAPAVECIYPMPAMYPREVFLAAANYYLHTTAIESAQLNPVVIAKSALMIARAVASGQLPRAA